MILSDRSTGRSRAAAVANWLHRNFLWLLLGCYLLAAVLPQPGLAIRNVSLTRPADGAHLAPLVMLAFLLFCAAVSVRVAQARELFKRPWLLVVAVIAIWLGPALAVAGLGLVLPPLTGNTVRAGTLVGLALVAAMPVANSSVGWTQHSGGNVALALALVIASILLSPLATPQLLRAMGLVLSANETAQCERLVAQFSGTFFIVWVILPSLAGMIAARLAGEERIARAKSWIRIVSGLNLLLLNYTNASLAMPAIFWTGTLSTVIPPLLLAILLCLVGVFASWLLTRLMMLSSSTWIALTFGCSMKHTGLALVLAGTVLKEQPHAIFLIVVATLTQHVVAGAADWYLHRFSNYLQRHT